MTTSAIPCPDCGAPLSADPVCPSCGLPVRGPVAGRLWAVDQRLRQLDTESAGLRAERVHLIASLRAGTGLPATAPATVLPAAARPETTPRQVQNTLLGLGALLLALAGIVFAAVTYNQLGVVGRAGVLLVLTGLAAGVPAVLVRRSLTASGEAVTTVALVLGVVDAWALRRAGVADGVDARTYAAVATAILSALAAGHAVVVPLRASRIGALTLAQAPAVYLLARFDASLPVVAVTLTGLAAVDLLLAAEVRLGQPLRHVSGALASVALLGALMASLRAVGDHDRAGAWGLLALAAVAAGSSARLVDRTLAGLAGGTVVPLLAGAAWAVARPELTEAQQPLVVVAVALLALQVCGLLPRARREGPVLGALGVASVALLVLAEPVLLAVAGPFTWLSHPWTLHAAAARDALSTEQRWDGTVVTLVVLVAVAGCAVAAGVVLDRLDAAVVPAGVLVVLSALVLPLGLATSYDGALALLLGVGALLGGAGTLLPRTHRAAGLGLVTAGFATTVLAAVWSVADQDATLVVLPIAALVAAGLSLRVPGVLSAAAALLLGAELAAGGAAQDLAPEQVGGLLLLAPAACAALAQLLRGAHRAGVEAAAAVLAVTCVVLAVDDPGWLSWTLATDGLCCLAVALRPDRRLVGVAGGLLLSASSWVRLADANVHAPEPYVAPLAVAALVLGYLRRRSQPGLGSFGAYGAGLSIALLPSLLKAFDDPEPTRGLLLLVVAGGLVLVGAKDHLRAPLVLGGAVVALDGLNLLAPYAAALPRWTLLAGAGLILVVLGATYEQRLRDVARLRSTYQSWT